MVQRTGEAIEKIRKRMLTAQSQQKSYADVQRRKLEFNVGAKVFLKVPPMKSIMRFGKKDKLSPRYIGPFEILERIGDVAYCWLLKINFALPIKSEKQNAAEAWYQELLKFFKTFLNL